MQVAEAFLGHAAVRGRLAEELGSRCAAALTLTFEGSVEPELEAIFCRGIEWDIGLEHLFLFQARCLSMHILVILGRLFAPPRVVLKNL